MMSAVGICPKILCWLRDVKRLIGYILKVYTRVVPRQECKDAGMKPLDTIWVDTDKSVDPTRKKIRSMLCAREYKTKKQGKIQRALPASQFSAMPPLDVVKVLVSIMMSVRVSNKGKTLKLRHYDISRAHFQGTAQRLIYIKLPAEDRKKFCEDKFGRLVKSMYGTQDASHIWQLDYVNLICGELGGFRRGKHSAALFHNPKQDVRMAVQGTTLCVCQTKMDSNTSTVFSNPNTQRKTWEHLDPQDSDVKSLLLLNRVSRVGADKNGQYLDVEPDLRHAPLIISESGCNMNTEAGEQHTREKLQDKLVLDGRRSPNLKNDEATRYRSACMRRFTLGQIRSVGNSGTFGPEDERASRIRFYPVETCSAISGGKAQSSAKISKTETC